MRTHGRTGIFVICLGAFAALAAPAAAQTANVKWEIEVHGGGMSPGNPTGGTAMLPGPGESFSTSGIYAPPAPQVLVVSSSRRESSWYFGDGSVLFNQAATAVAANPVAMTAPFSARVIPLDPVLGGSLDALMRGGSLGARVSRALTPRLGVELSVDYSLARLEITQANLDSIEATRASFVAAFNGLITGNSGRVLKNLTSTAAVEQGSARQWFTSAALLVNVKTAGRVAPYAVIGASLMSVRGELPSAVLSGNYVFSNASGATINETDTVTVRDARSTHSVAGIVGGGVKYHMSPRWGVKIDARVSLGKNTAATELDATPNVTLGQLPAGRVTLNANPTLQFGNSSGPVTALGVTAITPSTLSGPALTGFRTWSGSGISSHVNVTTGIFWRF